MFLNLFLDRYLPFNAPTVPQEHSGGFHMTQGDDSDSLVLRYDCLQREEEEETVGLEVEERRFLLCFTGNI